MLLLWFLFVVTCLPLRLTLATTSSPTFSCSILSGAHWGVGALFRPAMFHQDEFCEFEVAHEKPAPMIDCR